MFFSNTIRSIVKEQAGIRQNRPLPTHTLRKWLGEAGLGVDRRAGELGDQIAPGHCDLHPVCGIDGKAIAIARAKFSPSMNSSPPQVLEPSPLTQKLKPSYWSQSSLGLTQAVKNCGPRIPRTRTCTPCRTGHRPVPPSGRHFGVVLRGRLRRFVAYGRQIDQRRLRRLAPSLCGEEQDRNQKGICVSFHGGTSGGSLAGHDPTRLVRVGEEG